MLEDTNKGLAKLAEPLHLVANQGVIAAPEVQHLVKVKFTFSRFLERPQLIYKMNEPGGQSGFAGGQQSASGGQYGSAGSAGGASGFGGQAGGHAGGFTGAQGRSMHGGSIARIKFEL